MYERPSTSIDRDTRLLLFLLKIESQVYLWASYHNNELLSFNTWKQGLIHRNSVNTTVLNGYSNTSREQYFEY